MSARPRILALLAVFVALPAFASTHIWYGTTNERMSEPSNWSGGSPAGDPDAVLIFAPEAERFAVVNDIPFLQFREMRFEARGFSISGAPMNPIDSTIDTVYDVTISNDLVVGSMLTLRGLDIVLSGAISGGGGLQMTRSTVTLTGAASNTYEGETAVHSAMLILMKSGGAIAVSGDLLMTRAISPPRVSVIHAEQIADDATVRIEGGTLTLVEDETFRNLEIGGTVARGGGTALVPTLTVQSIFVLSESGIRTNLRVMFVETEFATLAAGRAVIIPDSGITLRSGGTVRWNSDTSAPTRIEGVRAELEVPNSAVRMSSGVFQGEAASLTATGGTIDGAEIGGDLRLTAGATVLLAPIRLNGFLNLGGAMLDLDERSLAGSSAILIDNASSQPVLGRFAGLPDGAVVDNRYLINYRGGDGNDVELVDLRKPRATLTPSQEPQPAIVGEPATLRVVLSGSRGTPTGTVTFSHIDGTVIGAAPIVDGVATLQVTFDDDAPAVLLRYSGDATYASESTEFFDMSFAWPQPVITSIEPSSGAPGESLLVTVRGERFMPGITLIGGTFTELFYISPTELLARLDLSSFRSADTLLIRAVQVDDTLSEGVPFAVVPDVETSAMLMFDEAGPFAHVSRGAKTAWLTSAEEHSTFFALDVDRNATVRWPLPNPRGIFAVVDLASGDFDVRATGGALREARAFPPHTFARDEHGNASRFVLPVDRDFIRIGWRILWARPGVGAWHMSLTDGEDLDGLHNSVLFGSIDSMIPLGDSPAHPNGFARGDVVIMMSPGAGLFASASSAYFAERLGELFEDTAPGVLRVLSRNYEFSETRIARVFVVRTDGSAGAATVRYSTLSRSAVAGVDFVAKSGTIAFAPGEVLKTIDIPLIDHDGYRGTDTRLFHVILSDATGAALAENVSVVQILSPDAPPTLTIVGPEDRQVRETDAPQPYTIELRLTGATELPAIVHWSAGEQSGEVTFAVGEWRKNMTLLLPGDDVEDGPTFVHVRFDLVTNATLAGATDIEIEVLEDDAPVLTGIDLSVDEGSAYPFASVGFSLEPAVMRTFSFETADGTATSEDYEPRYGWLDFVLGSTHAFAEIRIFDDDLLEGDETFTVTADNVAVATVTIRDDELTNRPVITVAPATVAEPLATSVAAFDVTLSSPSSFPISVHLVTRDQGAIAGADYQFTDETLHFAPGETKKTFVVPIFGDMLAEEDETFLVRIVAMLNAQVDGYFTLGTILKNEPQPRRTRAVAH